MSNRREAIFEFVRGAVPGWLRQTVPRPIKRWLRSIIGAGPSKGALGTTDRDIYYCYRLLLGREPDPDGWRTYTAKVNAGLSRDDLVAAFLTSPEFRNRAIDTGTSRPELVDFGAFRIYVWPDDWAVSQQILRNHAYEPHVTAAIRSVLRPGMVFVDVGANIGYFSLLAASCVGPTGKVFAFEPSSRNCALHQLSAKANGFEQIEIFPVAAAESSQLMIYDSQGSNGIVGDLAGDPAALASRQVVQAVALDDALRFAPSVDAIKLDIEGAEWRALNGARAVLKKHRPILFTELLPGGLANVSKVSGPQYLQFLVDEAYTLTVLRPDGEPLDCGTNTTGVMQQLETMGENHLDVLARPR